MDGVELREGSFDSSKKGIVHRKSSVVNSNLPDTILKEEEEIKSRYNSYYVKANEYSKNRNLGILLVIDIQKIETDRALQFDLMTTELDEKDQEKFTKLMKSKSTLKQVRLLLEKLSSIGLTIEQNKGSEDSNIFYVRISMSEIGLMETADKMGLEKKLKPFFVPPLAVEKEGVVTHSKGPIVEGGYIPFSLNRCDAYNKEHQVNNVWQGLLKVLPEEERIKFLDEKLLTDSEKSIKSSLDISKRVPYFKRIAEVYKHMCPAEESCANYPGLFLRSEESGGASLFSDAEKTTIILWKIRNEGGMHVDFFDNGTGNIMLRKKLDVDVLHVDNIDPEKLESPPDWIKCCFPKKSYPRKMIASSYARNPIGLIHFEAFTPTHDPVIKEELIRKWALGALTPCQSLSNFFSVKAWDTAFGQPIEEIKEYFGVKIALYFLFIGHFIYSLIIPAIIGASFTFYNYWFSYTSVNIGYLSYDTNASPYYSFYIICWGISFLEFWKRKQIDYAIKWGTVDLEGELSFRREWLDYYEAIEGTDDPDAVDLLKVDRYDSLYCINKRNYWGPGLLLKQYSSVAAVLVSIFLTLIVVFLIFVAHSWTITYGNANGTTLVMIGSSFSIIVLSFFYKKIAFLLNRWENHKTHSEEEDALIFKSFLFEFFNSYSALMFIAFGDKLFRGLMVKVLNNLDVSELPCLDQSSSVWNKYLAMQPDTEFFKGTLPILPKTKFYLESIITQMWNFNGSYEPLAWSGNDPHPGPLGQSSKGVSQFFTPVGLQGYYNITTAPSALVISVMDTYCHTQWCNYGTDFFNYEKALNQTSLPSLLADIEKFPENYILNPAFGTCGRCLRNDCVTEIANQLLTILLIKSVGMKLVNRVMFLVNQLFYFCRRRVIRKKNTHPTWFEQEMNLPYFVDVSGQYHELAVIYGFIMLFAVTFPIAPAICYFTTNFEMRSDALTMLLSRRAIPLKVPNIGAWYSVFSFITQISILTNVAIICFVANDGFFPYNSNVQLFARWEWLFLMCLIILCSAWLIGWILPDVSAASLKIQLNIRTKVEYIHKLLRYQQYYKSDESNFDLFPTADRYKTDLYLNEGYHLTKNEMLKLHLNQMLFQEEEINARRHANNKARLPKSPSSLLNINRSPRDLNEGESKITSHKELLINLLIKEVVPVGDKTLSREDMLNSLKSHRRSVSEVFVVDSTRIKDSRDDAHYENPLRRATLENSDGSHEGFKKEV